MMKLIEKLKCCYDEMKGKQEGKSNEKKMVSSKKKEK
jgi:hypothetical protein